MWKFILAGLVAIGVLSTGVQLATQALFTDTQVVADNTFTAGTLDISTSPSSTLLGLDAMVPGDNQTHPLIVSNGGNLQLRYALTTSATDPDGLGFRNQLELIIKTAGTGCSSFDGTTLYSGVLSSAGIGNPASGGQSGDRVLDAATSETLCFRIELPIDTDTQFQGATTNVTFTFEAEQTANNP